MSKSDRALPPVPEMSDLQLLTYLLTLSGECEEEARPIAHALLDSYDNLSAVIALPRSTLLGDPRLNESSATFLALVGEMASRYADRFHRSDVVVMNRNTVSRLLAPHLRGHDRERVCVIFVDQDFHLLGSGAVVTHGDTNNTALPIRRILSLALSSGAYGVILAHNHPDGTPFFSPADLMTTDVLRGKLAVLGVSLLDHYIWVSENVVSLYEQLHAASLPPPLDYWDLVKMPLLSRFDPQVFLSLQKGKQKSRRSRKPFFLDPSAKTNSSPSEP